MDLSLATNYLDELNTQYKSTTDECLQHNILYRMKQISKITCNDYKIVAEREVCRIMKKTPSMKLIRLEQTRRAKLFEITGQNL